MTSSVPNLTLGRSTSCFWFVRQWLRYTNRSIYTIQVLQASRGLAYLHSLEPPICHGDIKPQNILVNDEGEAVVSDFGLARVLNVLGDHSGFTTSSVGQGTKGYLAPELLNEDDARPTVQTDVFSFGGLILAVGRLPCNLTMRLTAPPTRL